MVRNDEFKKQCPMCDNDMFYSRKKTLERSINGNHVCYSCSHIKKPKIHKYSDEREKRRINTRKNNNQPWHSEETKLKMSKTYNTNRKKPGYYSVKNKELWKQKLSKIAKGRKLNKEWKNKIQIVLLNFNKNKEKTPEEILNDKKLYYRKVRKITRKQNINNLENFEKRGRAGIKNAYHLDHKISIIEGFIKNINPEIIGDINNLQFIPWEENIIKQANIKNTEEYIIKMKQIG